MSVRLAIVDDDRLFRQSLAAWFSGASGFVGVAVCGSAEEALECLPAVAPEVVLMDIHLPGRSGVECVTTLRGRMPDAQVIMLTVEESCAVVGPAWVAPGTRLTILILIPTLGVQERADDLHDDGLSRTGIWIWRLRRSTISNTVAAGRA